MLATRAAILGSKAFDLRNIPNAAGWLYPRGQTSGGGLVTLIPDIIGGNNASAAGSARPAVDSIGGVQAFLLDGGVHTVPSLNTPVSNAQTIIMVTDRTGLALPPTLSPILGSDATFFDFASGATQPNLFDGTHTSINLEGVSQQTPPNPGAEIRINGDWAEVVSEAAGTPTTIKPLAPSVITICAVGPVHFNNVGMDRVNTRTNCSRVGDIFWLTDQTPIAYILEVENQFLQAYGVTPSLSSRVIVFSGNSITAGQGAAAGSDFPTQSLALLNTPGAWKTSVNSRQYNVGIGAQTTEQMIANDPVHVYRKLSQYHSKNVVLGLEGGNSMKNGDTPVQAAAAMLQWYQNTLAICPNAIVGVGTCVTRVDVPDANIAAYNVALRAIIPAAAIIPYDLNPNLQPGWNLIPANSADGTHGTALSYGYFAATAAAWVNGVAP